MLDFDGSRKARRKDAALSGGILLLAFATLVIRYGSAKYPSVRADPGL